MAAACGEALWDNGRLVAVCRQPWGVEHPHGDMAPVEAVAGGFATWVEGAWEVMPADILLVDGEIMQINFTGFTALNLVS